MKKMKHWKSPFPERAEMEFKLSPRLGRLHSSLKRSPGFSMVSCVNGAHGSFTFQRKVRDRPNSRGWFDEYSTHCMKRFGTIKKKVSKHGLCLFSLFI